MNWLNLRADTNFLCGATSATYPDADKMRNMGVAYQRVATKIWESDPTYSWDDRNNTDGPVAYRTVANASAAYVIPTTAIRVRGVEIKDNSGHFHKLTPVTYEDLPFAPTEYLNQAGLPIHYMIEGNEIRLFPAPGTNSVTMSSGMAVHLSRSVTEPATSATTTEPGFASGFHRILSLAAAVDFIQDDKQREFLAIQRERLEQGLVKFYGKWAPQYKGGIKLIKRRYT